MARVRDDPRAFLTVDAGAATIALGLIGRIGSRWRLVGRLALPAGADPDAAIALLVERATTADPELTSRIGLDRTPIAELPRLAVSSHTPRRLAVVAGSERALGPLVAAASRSGWHVRSASAEAVDPLEMTTLLLDVGVDAILAGAGDPPAADERRALAELGALVAAAAHRRPDLSVILAGGMAGELHAFGDVSDRLGRVLVAAAARAGDGSDLRGLLTSIALPEDDARRALGGAVVALADVLDRRVDIVDIGYDAGTRAAAWPAGAADAAASDLAIVPSAGLAPADPDDDAVDRVATWSTWTSDRHRLRDRMRELRIAPWADATGEGAALRMAAARAALSCLARWTPGWNERPAADLVVATGGAWAVATPSAVALALADVLRRAGASQVALDHARLLAPLGIIPDASERRAMVADLAEDLLVPIGTVVTPGGLRHGRSAGSLEIHGVEGDRRRELRPGGLERIPLAPGGTAVAEFRFHDAVRLGGRGRHFAIDVTGGLGGLLVDLRDIPLRLPDRAELRSELLDAWQAAVASGDGP
jgi:hypothetical protein